MIAPQPKQKRVYVREPMQRRARFREAAMRHVARHGLYGLNLNAIARQLGEKHAIVRWHFKTNHGLLPDVVQTHHIRLGEALAESIVASRALPATERLPALIAAVLEALIAAGNWHRAAVAIAASLPEVAHALRNADLWLVDALSVAMRPRDPVRARTLLMLIEQWALRMADANAAERAACVGTLAAMVGMDTRQDAVDRLPPGTTG
ncbi:MAG TPA: hypothetical protein VFW75_06335 [Acetobacteraceae bacterium]|nr:hypothetical protein [Acetobacteraceae bacterium]